MPDFPVTSYQFETELPTVTVALDDFLREAVRTSEWDGFTLELTPDRADESAAALMAKADDCRNGSVDTQYIDD